MKTLASLATALIVVIAGPAVAQSQARIAWGDLDLRTVAGVQTFDARVDAAARRLCRDARRPNSRILDTVNCRAAVRAEALEKLPGAAHADYALSRRSIAV